MNDQTHSKGYLYGKRPSHDGTTLKTLIAAAAVVLAGHMVTPGHAQATNPVPPAPAAEAANCALNSTIWWNELLAPETDRLTDFYAKVMGWTPKIVDAERQAAPARAPDDRYTIFMDGQREVAGLMRSSHPESVYTSVGWFTYMQVADVEAAAEKAVAAGGKILREPIETSEGHVIALISDPMGNAFGLVTPAVKNPC